MRITFLGTGAGNSSRRAHTCIAVECPDGTNLLLDASSGNSALRHAAAAGIDIRRFDDVLLSHDHPDHMSGVDFIQFDRAIFSEDMAPLRVHASYEALEGLKRHSITTRLNIRDISGDFGRNYEGRKLLQWMPTDHGRMIELGPRTTAWHFQADHITGASGWRVECDGKSVVFSGDTRYSPDLVKAAQGVDLLIHEAFCVEDTALARAAGHCTGGEAGRAAAETSATSLAITHLTDTYHADPQPLGTEAAEYYTGPISLAYDLQQITLG